MSRHPLEMLTAAATAQAGHVYDNAQVRKGGGDGPDQHQTRVTRPGSLLDISGFALSGLSNVQTSILLLKYGSGGVSEWLCLLRAVLAEILRASCQEQNRRKRCKNKQVNPKPAPSSVLCNALTVTIVAEYIQTHVCQVCHGTREVWEQDKRKDCPACGGNGRIGWTGEDRARRVGISRRTYYRHAWLYAAGLSLLIAKESAAVSELRARMM